MPTGVTSDRLAGTLLCTALGDALGLPCEGMLARSIARRFGRVDRFRLLAKTGFVADDTEQSALVAQSLARHPDDVDAFVRATGLATLRSCVRIGLDVSPSGVVSAGNGAAMGAAIVGVFFHDLPEQRHEFGRALAQVTHRDERAIEGALFVAEVAASCAPSKNNVGRETYIDEARRVVTNRHLREAIDRSVDLACRGADLREAAQVCGASEFVVHTVPFATYCFLLYGDDPMRALTEAISAGGDTDSCGAMLGGWLGALHGEGGLPGDLIRRIHDGPFGPSHLRALTACLAQIQEDEPCRVPSYSPSMALARNLVMYPVILGHGFRRFVPF